MTADEAPTDSSPAVPMLGLELALVVAILISLAVMGPFGTYHQGLWTERLAYWARTLLAGWILYRPLLWVTDRAPRPLRIRRSIAWLAVVAAASAPMAVWLWFFGPIIRTDRPWFTGGQFVETYLQVLFMSGAIAGALYLLRSGPKEPPASFARRGTRADQGDDKACDGKGSDSPVLHQVGVIGIGLAERLPVHFGKDVIALKMEDHYVRVHTPLGSTLLLMRLGDALREVDAIEGAQVHRSWWVARHAIARVERTGRSAMLHLVNGIAVPVARNRIADLRSAGWLAENRQSSESPLLS